jgi:hypothetical protein
MGSEERGPYFVGCTCLHCFFQEAFSGSNNQWLSAEEGFAPHLVSLELLKKKRRAVCRVDERAQRGLVLLGGTWQLHRLRDGQGGQPGGARLEAPGHVL